MTKQETIECIKVMQAFVDGKEIEYLDLRRNKEWRHASYPIWDWTTFNYRIKSEPEKSRQELLDELKQLIQKYDFDEYIKSEIKF